MRILKIAIPQNFQKRNQIIDTKNMPAWDQQNIQRIGFIVPSGFSFFGKSYRDCSFLVNVETTLCVYWLLKNIKILSK